MFWREFWGVVTIAGLVLLIWDLLTIGAGETRTAPDLEAVTAAA
jgi:nitric oxide reductase subunit B